MKMSIRSVTTITLAFISFALLPDTQAVSPPPDGGYAKGNTAEGTNALFNVDISSIDGGRRNTALGFQTLYHDIFGGSNTAAGFEALFYNDGDNNTAYGYNSLYNNNGGSNNTGSGYEALFANTIGYRNTANGVNALFSNITGHGNTAIGFRALYQNTGSDNVAVGFNAGSNLTYGDGNVCIGDNVLGVAGESNTTRIKNVYSSAASGRAVYINSDNKIGTLVSSRRFKEEIKPMDDASEAILALKPVTFRYKKAIEPNGGIMFGLIAEEVEKVAPDLVTRDENGEAETVRYDAVNAMLLNEFLKEHRKVQEQEATITKLRSELQANAARQQKQIEALAVGLQKVSAQLEMAAGEVATNDQ